MKKLALIAATILSSIPFLALGDIGKITPPTPQTYTCPTLPNIFYIGGSFTVASPVVWVQWHISNVPQVLPVGTRVDLDNETKANFNHIYIPSPDGQMSCYYTLTDSGKSYTLLVRAYSMASCKQIDQRSAKCIAWPK